MIKRINNIAKLVAIVISVSFLISACSSGADIKPATEVAAHSEGTIVSVSEAFRLALVQHDSLAATQLLSEDVVIMEGGKVESKEEYLSHHFHSDSRFLASMDRDLKQRSIDFEGNVAWQSSISTLTGERDGQPFVVTSAELLVLRFLDQAWTIEAVHWSSR